MRLKAPHAAEPAPDAEAHAEQVLQARVRAARAHSRWVELDPVDLVARGHLYVSAETDDCYVWHPGVVFARNSAAPVADMAGLYYVVDNEEITFMEKQPPKWSARVQRQAQRDAKRARTA